MQWVRIRKPGLQIANTKIQPPRALGLVSFVATFLPESFFMDLVQIAVSMEGFRLFQLGYCPAFSIQIFLSVWIFSAFGCISAPPQLTFS